MSSQLWRRASVHTNYSSLAYNCSVHAMGYAVLPQPVSSQRGLPRRLWWEHHQKTSTLFPRRCSAPPSTDIKSQHGNYDSSIHNE